MTTYRGSCHCGRITFEADGEIDSATECNCSMCRRKGILMWFIPRGALRLLTPEDNASTYLFNKHKIKHRFCATCGIHPYGEATSPSGQPRASVNLRCIDEVNLHAVPVKQFDGRSL
jgi:hypothetical protein